MKQPKISMLSTVGVLKHYVQDYPLHPLRTDFVGENGTGKSVIADLLQLIFIQSSKLIHFGTDGLNPEQRSIHTLPHKGTSVAYAFITVEVDDGRFVVLGVVLSSRESAPVTPFLILKSADLDADLSEWALGAEDHLKATDFTLGKGIIPDAAQLGRHLLTERGLHFILFSGKDRVHEYYTFLYRKEVLPINLAQEENSRTFAKIIQAFSKAKTLNLGTSKSLKEFLFDDADADFAIEYEAQQQSLKRLMGDYESLSADIKKLEHQQARLKHLRDLDNQSLEAMQEYRGAEIASTDTAIRNLHIDLEELEKELEKEKRRRVVLESDTHRLPRMTAWARKTAADAETALQNIRALEEAVEKHQTLTHDIQLLKSIRPLPCTDAHEVVSSRVALNDRSAGEIKDWIETARASTERYGSFAAIEEARNAQAALLTEALVAVHRKQKELSGIIEILKGGAPESLLGWALAAGMELSEAQEAVVIAFAGMPVQKPANPVAGQQYVPEPSEILQATLQEVDSQGGSWLALGPVRQFIQSASRKRLFEHAGQIQSSASAMRAVLVQEETSLNEEAIALRGGLEGTASAVLQKLGLVNDEALLSSAGIDKIRSGIAASNELPTRIEMLHAAADDAQKTIAELNGQRALDFKNREPSTLREFLTQHKSARNDLAFKLSKREGTAKSEKDALERTLSQFGDRHTAQTKALLEASAKAGGLKARYFSDYSKTLEPEDLGVFSNDLESYKHRAGEARVAHQVLYRQIAEEFEETKSDRNEGVRLQIAEGSFGFAALERALLPPKIAHTDNIGAALETANRERLKVIENIRGSMAKVFRKTAAVYKAYETRVRRLNLFFSDRRISNRFVFKLRFSEHPLHKIAYLDDLADKVSNAHRAGELQLNQPVEDYLEGMYAHLAKLGSRVSVQKLLNPKTFFELTVSLADDSGTEIPGSTGESYSAIALLGIARLIKAEQSERRGLRFLILEEVSSLDSTNFSTFPAIAEEFSYQIITMSPKPSNINLWDEWYLHHLIKGRTAIDINHAPVSYFHTGGGQEALPSIVQQAAP